MIFNVADHLPLPKRDFPNSPQSASGQRSNGIQSGKDCHCELAKQFPGKTEIASLARNDIVA